MGGVITQTMPELNLDSASACIQQVCHHNIRNVYCFSFERLNQNR
jgi:hypothetical protein